MLKKPEGSLDFALECGNNSSPQIQRAFAGCLPARFSAKQGLTLAALFGFITALLRRDNLCTQ
jgi:hypothetical protein